MPSKVPFPQDVPPEDVRSKLLERMADDAMWAVASGAAIGLVAGLVFLPSGKRRVPTRARPSD